MFYNLVVKDVNAKEKDVSYDLEFLIDLDKVQAVSSVITDKTNYYFFVHLENGVVKVPLGPNFKEFYNKSEDVRRISEIRSSLVDALLNR